MLPRNDSQQFAVTRREVLSAGTVGLAAALIESNAHAAPEPGGEWRPHYCLNMSTIRGQQLSLPEEVELAAKVGYDGIEPWIREIEQYRDGGGNLSDLRKRIKDAGLSVFGAIGFANWIIDDEVQRRAGLEQAKRDMELVRAIGGTHIAAPPVGAHRADAPKIDLFVIAERYRTLLEAGEEIGIVAQVEIWGPSRNLSRLGEAVLVAVESGHPDACVLPDVYHIYRGGSEFTGLKVIAGGALHCFHINDYPAAEDRATLSDADRVYPGDGDAPLADILRMLDGVRFQGALSLELFNRDYWQQPAEDVARTGLAKMKAAVAAVSMEPSRSA